MDPRRSAQDVARCDHCKENIAKSYCDICHVSLCNPCIGDHISDGYHKHVIVPFKERKSTLKFPICKIHSKETCKLQCKSCNLFLCVICSASHEHKESDFIVLEDTCKTKKGGIKKDAEEIEKVIAPTYEEIRNELFSQIANLDGDYQKITTVILDQGEKWHTEVDRVINKMNNEITEIKEKHCDILEKHLNEIKQIESLIVGNLSTLKEHEESNDVSVIVEYRPRFKEFRKPPAKVHVTLPSFSPKPINGEQFYEMLGSLKPFQPRGITTDSQSRILTADYNNDCIHILDQDGQFLHYIEDVKNPQGLCVDNHDNLYVAEYWTGNVKVIRYLK